VDFQVRVSVYVCGQGPAVVTSVKVMMGAPSQLSVEVGLPVFAGNVLAEQRMVMLAGQEIAGATLSLTKMI